MRQFGVDASSLVACWNSTTISLPVHLALASAMAGPPLIFDRRLHARRLERASSGFAAADFLKQRGAGDIVERLEAINRRFPLAADLSARDGTFARALAASDAAGKIDMLVQTDLSPAMLSRAQGPRLV